MPKLPADLPENWTRGQFVSPNGTETGLTEKHGYNYLMKQVNNTQTEVNNINTALTDVAQQETVDEIKNKIGTESDADTQPTLFGRLAQLKNVVVEKLAEVLTKVTGIDGKIGDNEDTEGDETLFGKIKEVGSSVKSGDTLVYIPSSNVKKTLVNSEISKPKSDSNTLLFLGYFKALHSGIVRVNASFKIGTPSGTSAGISVNVYLIGNYDNSGDIRFGWGAPLPKYNKGDVLPIGDIHYGNSSIGLSDYNRVYKEFSTNLSVTSGSIYMFMLDCPRDYPAYCNKLTIAYDEVEEDTL